MCRMRYLPGFMPGGRDYDPRRQAQGRIHRRQTMHPLLLLPRTLPRGRRRTSAKPHAQAVGNRRRRKVRLKPCLAARYETEENSVFAGFEAARNSLALGNQNGENTTARPPVRIALLLSFLYFQKTRLHRKRSVFLPHVLVRWPYSGAFSYDDVHGSSPGLKLKSWRTYRLNHEPTLTLLCLGASIIQFQVRYGFFAARRPHFFFFDSSNAASACLCSAPCNSRL